MAEALTFAGARGSLAGEAAGDDVNGGGMSVNCSDVGVDGHSGEPLLEQLASEGVEFAEPAVLQAGQVEAVGEEAAAVEQSADRESIKHRSLPGRPRGR